MDRRLPEEGYITSDKLTQGSKTRNPNGGHPPESRPKKNAQTVRIMGFGPRKLETRDNFVKIFECLMPSFIIKAAIALIRNFSQ